MDGNASEENFDYESDRAESSLLADDEINQMIQAMVQEGRAGDSSEYDYGLQTGQTSPEPLEQSQTVASQDLRNDPVNREISSEAESLTGSEFLNAAEKGDVNAVKNALSCGGFNIDRKTKYQSRSALHLACGYGQLAVVEQLLKSGADPVQFSGTGRTPLHEACQGGHTDVLTLLVKHTRELDTQDRDGQSPAHVAAFNGEVQCLSILNRNGATLTIEDRLSRQPAHLAAMRNQAGVLEYLYDESIDLECADNQGRNPLHYAAQHGALQCLVSLVQRDCDITLGDVRGSLPVHYAALHNHLECVRFLMKRGASTEFTQSEGKLVTHMAAQAGSRKVLHWLLHQNINPDLKDNHGNTALHYCGEAGKAECFNCLIQHGANSELLNNDGVSPLQAARKGGHPVLIERALRGEVVCRECQAECDLADWRNKHRAPAVLTSVSHLQSRAYKSPLRPQSQPQKNIKKTISSPTKSTSNKSPSDSFFLTESSTKVIPKRNLPAKYFGEHLPSVTQSDK